MEGCGIALLCMIEIVRRHADIVETHYTCHKSCEHRCDLISDLALCKRYWQEREKCDCIKREEPYNKQRESSQINKCMNCGDDSRQKAKPAPQADLLFIALPLVVENCEHDHDYNDRTKPYELLFIRYSDTVPKCTEKSIHI